MPGADLHLHSRYSVFSSEYLVRMLELNDSYTGIDTLYAQAKARGMNFVTVTDHDTIDGALELVAEFLDSIRATQTGHGGEPGTRAGVTIPSPEPRFGPCPLAAENRGS
ncbi:MAG: PHP domain-containing protein [Arenicellales bacterium]